ncbi:MAG: deoxyribonuclease IV [Clostridia bacterium]|nr:deoxyribonuclease IV [Clostridia bacterium]
MLKIGCHLSASKGFFKMAKECEEIGANTFQFFTRNPRGGKAKDIDIEDIKKYNEKAKQIGIEVIVAHAPYTLNLAAKDEGIRNFAKEVLEDDLKRMEYVPGNLYNFHPGSHVGQGEEIGINYIIGILNEVLKKNQTTTVLLETMAGKGSEIGRNFEEIKRIMDGVKLKEKIGVCLDTCHVNDAGYDVKNNIDKVLDNFDEIIGLSNLKAIHLNDSMNEIGSHKDRHQKIGEGTIGIDSIMKIVKNDRIKELPFILETPNELEGYKKEIELIKKLY